MNDNQNVFIQGNRTTSRVLNEPGGKSSVNLGWDSPKAKEPSKETQKENRMQVAGSAAATASTKDLKAAINDDKQKMAALTRSGPKVGGRGVSSNEYASGSSQNTGNVITDRPTSRVTQPPGGKSSISFY